MIGAPPGLAELRRADTAEQDVFARTLDEIGSGLDQAFSGADDGSVEPDGIAARVRDLVGSQLEAGRLTREQADALNELLTYDETDGDELDLELCPAADGEGPTAWDEGQGTAFVTVAEFLKQVLAAEPGGGYGVAGRQVSRSSRPLLFDQHA